MSLAVQHISKSYGDNQVLDDVSFSLEKGKIYVLMGTNGSGKTTLFNIITGFIEPESGTVTLDSNQLTTLSPYQINRVGIARSFQDLRLINELTVLENVLLAFRGQEGEKWWRSFFPNKTTKNELGSLKGAAVRILKECFIDNVSGLKAGEISYGQQKLLTMACCIANDSKVLLLDEPVSGINTLYQERLIEILQQLKAKNKTVLAIEHNLDFIESVADHILFLNEGNILSYENYTELRNDRFILEAYL